jgi:hypothetical protein
VAYDTTGKGSPFGASGDFQGKPLVAGKRYAKTYRLDSVSFQLDNRR